MIIPFNIPYLSGKEEEYLKDSLQSHAHCGNHHYGKKCIELMKKLYGFHEVFLTPSGTASLEMGAILADLHLEDEVILPSYTFSSTANAIILCGARPVFCDVDSATMNIDVSLIEALITEKTKMILPIDYAGIPCEIEAIMEIAEKHDLIVMQDAAQSIHSYHRNGKASGAVPSLSAFSFHESKNVSCGEGGALIVNDPELVERAYFVQEKGTDRRLVLKGLKNKYVWVDIGSSFLLADILAGMLFAQLENVDIISKKRMKVFDAYKQLYAPYVANGFIQTLAPPEETRLNGHAYIIIFNTEDQRHQFLDDLKTKEIYPYIGYIPLHSSDMGLKFGYKPEDLPITESLGKRIVRLPLYPDLADDGLDYCINGMGETLSHLYS